MRERFWDFVAARHHVWHLRFEEGVIPPWTTDTALRDYHFTNVYRDLDPGTTFLRAWLRVHREQMAEPAEAVFNALAYRYCMTEAGARAAGWLALRSGAVRRVAEAAAHPWFWHSAYHIRPYGPGANAKGLPRETGLRILLQDWIDQRDRMARALDLRNREDVAGQLQKLPGVGPFLAYQVLADLSYEGDEVLRCGGNDGWVLPGPGALKGASLLLGGRASADDARSLIDQLSAEQDDELGAREFPWWYGGEQEGPLSKADLQNCLCEFYKYVALSDGKRPRIRRYHGGGG